jgi:polysaccharide export outer membrane protein
VDPAALETPPSKAAAKTPSAPAPKAPAEAKPAATPPALGVVTIQPGCRIRVTLTDGATRGGTYVADAAGAVSIGELGLVALRNKTEPAAAAAIGNLLGKRGSTNTDVRVEILAASYDTLEVRGAVVSPGPVQIDPGGRLSLNDALLRAGGVPVDPRGAVVRVLRGGLTQAVADLSQAETYSLVDGGGRPAVPSVWLANNDVVYVFTGGAEDVVEVGERQITVLGEVPKPGVYRFNETEPCTLLHLLLKIEELTAYADARAVEIHRRGPDGRETVQTVNVEPLLEEGRRSDDVPLRNGDRIVVPARRLSLF